MGHLRIGALPRTKRWSAVVAAIGELSGVGGSSYSEIAEKTLDASNRSLRQLPEDLALQKCFQFLVALSVAGKSTDAEGSARELGIKIEGNPTKLQLAKSLRTWLSELDPKSYNPEFASLARKATADTIAAWINEHSETPQLNLFSNLKDPYKPWRDASSGRGFCELSRSFFSNFTQRYLNFFLSRTASSQLQTMKERERFSSAIKSNTESITTHAFETSKIVQSFSAGWFNKHASEKTIPSLENIHGFLSNSFEKIREEFRRQREAPK